MKNLLFALLLACLYGSMARGQTVVYWFDQDGASIATARPTNGSFQADASSLANGLHALHVAYMLDDGKLSSPTTRYFQRVSMPENVDHMELLCAIDGEYHSHQRVAASNGVAVTDIDLESVSEGLHSIMLQAVTPNGGMSNTYNGFFVRTVPPTPETLHCYYFIDNETESHDMGVVSQDGIVHFDLDLSGVSIGLHSITYILTGSKGGQHVQKRFFLKTPNGGNCITKYQYWTNDDVANVQTTVLPERQPTLQLVSLLPVASQPLRSALFHFEVKDGQPTMYAKNTLHVRCYDDYGVYGEVNEDYVDYAVSQPVIDFGTLQSGERETIEHPAANTVKWYSLQIERGDSLRFRLDNAATLQVFTAAGDVAYSVLGMQSKSWGGFHAEETGTYYVALHDVTATKGTTVSIDYEHIDKYAVLKQDVTAVGNGGPSTITFQGNGFDELTSVDLKLSETTITSSSISNDGKATASVKFNFNEAPQGTYKAVFHFQEGDVTVDNCITVNAPIAVSTTATVSYAKQFLLSQGNEYRFKLKNLGNMTAYDVPLQLRVYTTDASNLAWITIDGEEMTSYTENQDDTDVEDYPYKRVYSLTRTLRPSSSELLSIRLKTLRMERVYVYIDEVGGPSDPVASLDPNDIYGYEGETGDKTIRDGRTQVFYTIEFENDSTFATAPAHDIYVTDVLDPNLFDLSTFAPTRVKVGPKEMQLDGSKNGTVTFSMMPEIYAIAQLDWSLDETTGTVSWHISSLDPLTVEPTEELNSGVLPVNVDGSGIGELSFDIQIKPDLADGTEIPNRATITFDENEPIVTPIWTNVVKTVLKGDVNGDGVVNLTDASWIVRYFVGRTPDGFDDEAADVDGDGSVNLSDARKVVGIFVGKQ